MKLSRTAILCLFAAAGAGAVDCNACDDNCSWWDVECQGKKAACKAMAATIEIVTAPIEAVCANDPDRMEGREVLEEAKGLLVTLGAFAENEFDGVQIRFCSAMNWGSGLTPSPSKILLHTTYIDEDVETVALILAHEMVHIRQYRAWGTEGFQCRYGVEVANGHGWGPGNAVEDEAYDFVDILASGEETVRNTYCRVLYRDADPVGLQVHIGFLLNGGTVKQLVAAFAHSPEFENNFVLGHSPVDVVTTLYDALLARGPDPVGLEGWINVFLNEGYHANVDGILMSAEYNNNFGDDLVPGGGREGCP